jgi:protein quaking
MCKVLVKYFSALNIEKKNRNTIINHINHCTPKILRVSTLLENASILNQSGLEHGSPLTMRGLYSNGAATDMNGWTSTFQSEVWILTI